MVSVVGRIGWSWVGVVVVVLSWGFKVEWLDMFDVVNLVMGKVIGELLIESKDEVVLKFEVFVVG